MSKTAVISGVGSGLGAALVRKFASEGYQVGLLARSPNYIEGLAEELLQEGVKALAVPTDITDPQQVTRGFAQVREELGPVNVLINHAGNASWKGFHELTLDEFEQSWRVCAYGSFLCAREVVDDMLSVGRGTILFTGATSSIRGRAGAVAFSSAKFAVRGLAWALARELWPEGIHVAHVIIDGVLATPSVREGGHVEEGEPLLNIDAVAAAYWSLVQQDKGAWGFEIDLRPHDEGFFE